ncbi:MAG TPA: oligosaccharide flippase family protein [Candidatus Paceibacterota bacterium]|nr:oligosaccharide flippase family protein [Candidatus Paceibacterota bacterium]
MKKNIVNYYYRHQENIKNFFWRALQIGGKQGSLLVLTLFSSKILSVENFGNFSYYFSIILLCSMVSDFGISTAMGKFFAEYRYKERSKLNSIFISSVYILIGFFLTIGLCVYFLNTLYFKSKLILILIPLVFLIPFSSILDGIFRGLEQFKQLSRIVIFSSLFSFPLILCLIYFFRSEGLAYGYGFFYSCLSLFSLIYYIRGSGESGKFKPKWDTSKKLIIYSFYLGLASVSYFLFSRFSIIYLGYLGELKLVGFLEIIWRFESLFLLPFFILGHILAPKMTFLWCSGEKSKLHLKFKRNWKYSVISSLITSTLFFFFSYFLLNVLFKEFMVENSLQMIFLISIIFIIKAYAVLIDFCFIIPTGYGNLMAPIYTSVAFANIFLMYILNSFWGSTGVIFSILISHVAMVIVLHTKFYSIISR